MVDESRIKIYKYVESLLTEAVTENVYLMNEPQELTGNDTKNGFIVITVGDVIDAGEFHSQAYGMVRVYVAAYIPPITRGRLNIELYEQYENAINGVLEQASEQDNQGTYWIQPDSIISADMGEDTNANNAYHMFVKSFIVVIDKQE